jgi:hypothetical protein
MHGRGGKHICKPAPHEIAAPPASPLLMSKGPAPIDDDDSDTGEAPPRAALDGGKAASLDSFAAPLPPRRDDFGGR